MDHDALLQAVRELQDSHDVDDDTMLLMTLEYISGKGLGDDFVNVAEHLLNPDEAA
jgi:hypothetical protein